MRDRVKLLLILSLTLLCHNSYSIDIIWYRISKSNLTYITVIIPYGSSQDPAEKMGMAHLMEHLFFRQSGLKRSLDYLAVRYNAVTRWEWIEFHFSLPTENLNSTLKLIISALMNPSITEEGFLTERQVVITEMKLRSKLGNSQAVSKLLSALGFPENEGGSPDTLSKIKFKDELRLMQTFLPQGKILVFSAREPALETFSLREFPKFAGDTLKMKTSMTTDKVKDIAVSPSVTSERDVILSVKSSDISNPILMIGYRVPGTCEDLKAALTFDLIGLLLAGQISSLSTNLKLEGLITGSEVSYPTRTGDSYMILIYHLTSKEVIDKVINRFDEYLKEITGEGNGKRWETDLELVKHYLRYNYIMMSDDPESLAGNVTFWVGLNLPHMHYNYPKFVNSVTPADVREVMRKYMRWRVILKVE